MKPIDYRNATWEDVQQRVTGQLQCVYGYLHLFGPCTTRVLAEKSGINVLTIRPRVHDLCTLGLARLYGERRGKEGRYEGVSMLEAALRFSQEQERLKAEGTQTEMRLQA